MAGHRRRGTPVGDVLHGRGDQGPHQTGEHDGVLGGRADIAGLAVHEHGDAPAGPRQRAPSPVPGGPRYRLGDIRLDVTLREGARSLSKADRAMEYRNDTWSADMDLIPGERVASAASAQRDSDAWVKSYRYLRTAMVGLLLGLAAAVFFQTGHQGFRLLASVSAYYYTPAQAIFVGALIGVGACMIALKGTTVVEDVMLNLGGMFAAVVAIVPTSRGADYETAVHVCRRSGDGALLTGKAGGLDCPTVEALARATRENVENNMSALLFVGLLGLLATVLFALRDGRRSGRGVARHVRVGFLVAATVFVIAVVTFLTSVDRFVAYAHYAAATGLFVCIVVVALANVRRRQTGRDTAGDSATVREVGSALLRSRDRYAWIARAMVAAVVVMGGLLIFGVTTLFWLEIVVSLLFAVFWMVQTVERLDDEQAPATGA
jgi:hypothetical protein